MRPRTIAFVFFVSLATLPLVAMPQFPKPANPQKTGQIELQVDYCGGNAGLLVHIPGRNQQVILGTNGQGVFNFVVPGTYALVVQFADKPSHTIPNVMVQNNVVTKVNETICRDSDGDGVLEDVDCNDNNPNIYPGAPEECDGVDNNCGGGVDEGCELCTDADGDGFFAQAGCLTQIDCDDTMPTISPIAQEICDAIDNNCDTQVDEGFEFQNDPNNCGACDIVCPSGICSGGECEPPPSCDDDNPCTSDAYDPGAGVCVNTDEPDGTPCGTDLTCQGGDCIALLPNGEACAIDGDCLSNSCVDGVCCESSCGSECESCAQPGFEGVCRSYASGSDPENECLPYTCSGTSSCLNSCSSNTDCAPFYICLDTECVS